VEKPIEMDRALSALKNATMLTILFLAARLASEEQIKQIGASLHLAADHVEGAASSGTDWPCDSSFVREIASILEGTLSPPSWVPEVMAGGKFETQSSRDSRPNDLAQPPRAPSKSR
jgi:hypothetical protein